MAGVLHFVIPQFYINLIPPYLPDHGILVIISGIVEIALGVIILMGDKAWSALSAIGLMFLLVLFFPVHIYFIQQSKCSYPGICWIAVFAWVRLLIIHPLFWYWLWTVGREFFVKNKE